jgi:hypothetical protein
MPLPKFFLGFVSKLSAGNYMMESNHGRLSAGDVGSTGLWRALYLAIALLSGVGLAGKIALIRKVLPLPTPAVVMVVGVAICLPLLWPLALRFRFVLAPLAITGLLFAPLVLFPKVQQLHSVGRGTDQSDCVIVAANELTAGHWPYQQDKMWSHNPMSCGPGWVAAQAPLVKTLGYRLFSACFAFAPDSGLPPQMERIACHSVSRLQLCLRRRASFDAAPRCLLW